MANDKQAHTEKPGNASDQTERHVIRSCISGLYLSGRGEMMKTTANVIADVLKVYGELPRSHRLQTLRWMRDSNIETKEQKEFMRLVLSCQLFDAVLAQGIDNTHILHNIDHAARQVKARRTGKNE
jgi:hypothetical protein